MPEEPSSMKYLIDLVVMIATVAIAFYAYSADKAYHAIAKVAERLEEIARQQVTILAGRDEPLIVARIEAQMDENNVARSEALVIRNRGHAVVELSVETYAVFECAYTHAINHVIKRIGTIGYYGAQGNIHQDEDIIFRTFPTTYRDLMIAAHNRTDVAVNGHRVLIRFLQFFKIEYMTRMGVERTRWFSVSAFGAQEIPDDEGAALVALLRNDTQAPLFIFYRDNIEELWQIVAAIAPEQPVET